MIATLDARSKGTIERFVLPNGLTAIVKSEPLSGLCSAQLWVKTGSIHEDTWIGSGLSHYLEHLLFKGTQRRSGKEITQEAHRLGADFNAYTSFERTVYYLQAPGDAVESVLDLLADLCLNAVLPPDEVVRERDVILREIDMTQDDPDHCVSQNLLEVAYRRHPYGQPIIGHRPLFEAVDRDALMDYYRTRYAPNNMALILVGAFDLRDCRRHVEAAFGSFRMRLLANPLIPEELLQLAERRCHVQGPYQIVRGALAFKIPGLRDPSAPALDILAHALGQGNSSILWQRLREKRKLVHSINAATWNPGASGLFWISYTCDPGKRDAVEAAVRQEIADVARIGVPSSFLDKAVRQTIVGEINSRKTISGWASRLGAAEVVIGDLDYPRRYLRRLAETSPGTLQSLARDYLTPDRCTLASLEPDTASAASTSHTISTNFTKIRRIAFSSETLSNGVRLLLHPCGDLPKTHLTIAGLGGPLYETPDHCGATALMATLLTRDTARRSACEVVEAIERVGGSFSGFVDDNIFGLHLEVLSEDIDLALDLLEEALLAPSFCQDSVAVERAAQLTEIKEQEDDIVAFGQRRLRRQFFGEHAYAVDSLGDTATVAALTPAMLRTHYERLVVAPNLVVAAAGDFDPETLAPRVSKLMSRLPSPAFTVQQPPFTGPAQTGRHTLRLPREQAVVFQAYPDVSVTDDHFIIGHVLDELFSGMSSRLFEKVREERGMAYFVGSSRLPGISTGMFQFYAGTHPKFHLEVLKEIETEVSRVRDGGVRTAELERCRARLKTHKRAGLQTIGGRASQAARNSLYRLAIDDWSDYETRLAAVTLESLQDFAQTHFTPSNKVELIILPTSYVS